MGTRGPWGLICPLETGLRMEAVRGMGPVLSIGTSIPPNVAKGITAPASPGFCGHDGWLRSQDKPQKASRKANAFLRENAQPISFGSEMLGLTGEISRIAMSS